MCSSSREEIVASVDALRAAWKCVLDLTFDALTTPERLNLLEGFEVFRRQLPAVEHALINELVGEEPAVIGGKLPAVLANRLRITRAEASRRIHEAADLGERRALNGEPLPPVLEATAAAQRSGDLGSGHVAVIRSFWHRIPDFVDIETRARAEADLARLGGEHRPDELAKLADKLMDCLNPDGDFSDVDRAKRRGITIGRQDIDGMSPINGWLTPEARATIDAVFAKLAAPGMCNPADHEPCVSGTPSQAAIQGDTRSAAQRTHDALVAAGRALLASGDLGQHNGLPTSIIVTATLQELEKGADRGLTAGGTLLPMSDVIRLAQHAHHYLAIFDRGKALALYHTKRLASPAQRIMARQGSWLHLPRLHPARLPVRGPPRRPLQVQPDQRRQPHDPDVPPQPRHDRTRLDHPQKQPLPNPMDPTTTPRPRPTPHQHLPPPRKTATGR